MDDRKGIAEIKTWFGAGDGPPSERLTTTPANPGNPQQVAIRMYGQGLGDCFLIAFPRAEDDGSNPYYVVIDCGVVQGTSNPEDRMRKVAYGIEQATGGHIDLLVITHQHWDHVSGFLLATEYWEKITIDAIWLAWTEQMDGSSEMRETQDLLRGLRKQQEKVVSLLARQASRLGLEESAPELFSRAAFLGIDPMGANDDSQKDSKTEKAMQIAAGFNKENITYCQPGDVLPVGQDTGVRAFVLGPPINYTRLRVCDPRDEGYHWPENRDPDEIARQGAGARPRKPTLAQGRQALRRDALELTEMSAFAASVLSQFDGETPAGSDVSDLMDRSFPFDRRYRAALPLAEMAGETQFAEWEAQWVHLKKAKKVPPPAPVFAAYSDPINAWRRIDYDWLGVAETLAIAADDLTNNTSLVLAFELPAATGAEQDRRVLLFVGDAQAGNWLSWDDIEQWRGVGTEAPAAKPDMDDLLGRTIFYKVGHHGSHNASLKGKGVERMATKSKELTAFIPVSYPIAHEVWRWCEMPFDPLCLDLIERTQGRVFTPLGPLTREPRIGGDDGGNLPAFEQSTLRLPPKVRSKDGKVLEREVPFWIQVRLKP